MPSQLLTERNRATLILTLCDPDSRNSLSQQLVSAFAEALDVAESDPQVSCVAVRGEGAHFCSGLDPAELLQPALPGFASPLVQGLDQLLEALRVFPKPVLAAVEGSACGGGLSLALACDLMVAADDASFALGRPAVGPGAATAGAEPGAFERLADALPPSLLQHLVWLDEPIGAQRLHALGRVGWISPPGQALAEALRIADRLAALAPQTLAEAKERVQLLRAPRPRGNANHSSSAGVDQAS